MIIIMLMIMITIMLMTMKNDNDNDNDNGNDSDNDNDNDNNRCKSFITGVIWLDLLTRLTLNTLQLNLFRDGKGSLQYNLLQ